MFRRVAASLSTFAVLAPLAWASPAPALSLEPVGTFEQPVYVTSDPSDADRLFVVERKGQIKLVEGETVSTYFDLEPSVLCCATERGMGSIALAPDFTTSGTFYAAYSAKDGPLTDAGDLVVEEVIVPTDSEGTVGQRLLLVVEHDEFDIHYGGQLQFGPDGYLYLSTGDGGFLDPYQAGQDPADPRGKILRLDPESDPFEYEVWARGLRNPFRFSFDRLSGGLAIADVGQSEREELDWAPSPGPGLVGGSGANYGWSCREGLLAFPSADPVCAGKGAGDFDSPVFEYGHVDPATAGTICGGSIIGGYVVRDPDPELGALYGRYVYADYCTGDVRSLRLPATSDGLASDDCSLGLPVSRPTSFGEDAGGRLYIATRGGGGNPGQVFRLAGPPFEACPPQSPQPPGPRLDPPPLLPRVSIRSARTRLPNRLRIVVSVTPCAEHSGERLVLLRGGKPNGSKRLGASCTVRFLRRVPRRSSFRAVLSSGGSSRSLPIGASGPLPR